MKNGRVVFMGGSSLPSNSCAVFVDVFSHVFSSQIVTPDCQHTLQ